nr:ATP-dependent DNA helicase pif1-like [Ipomoea batatas]
MIDNIKPQSTDLAILSLFVIRVFHDLRKRKKIGAAQDRGNQGTSKSEIEDENRAPNELRTTHLGVKRRSLHLLQFSCHVGLKHNHNELFAWTNLLIVRLQGADRMDRDIVSALIQLMSGNPYGQFFRSLKDIAQTDKFSIILRSDISMDQRTHNMPSASQVAAIWIEDNGDGLDGNRNIRVHAHSGRSQYIQYYYGCYDPLQYPLLFPHGDIGWLSMSTQEKEDREIAAEYNIQVSEYDLLCVEKLNVEQRNAFDTIMTSIISNSSGVYFIDGPGGTGKTFLYKCLLATVRSRKWIALATASSGIAASILPGGRTAHSTFKIPIDGDDKLILWDEASMANRRAIESVDTTLRDIMDTDQIFGGKVVVFGGDFRQTLPVIRYGKKEDFIEASLVKSPLIWPTIRRLKLVQNIRANEDPAFCEYLMKIGDGTEQLVGRDKIKIPSSFIIPCTNEDTSLDALFQSVYPDLTCFETDPYSLMSKAILTPKNEIADEINSILIDRFPGEISLVESHGDSAFFTSPIAYSEHASSSAPLCLPQDRDKFSILEGATLSLFAWAEIVPVCRRHELLSIGDWFPQWIQQDQSILSMLISSMAEDVLHLAIRHATSCSIWLAVETVSSLTTKDGTHHHYSGCIPPQRPSVPLQG